MRLLAGNFGTRAFGRVDVLALLTMVALLAAICVPQAAAKTKQRGSRVLCTSNLKQVALGLALWAEEHDKRLPMQVSWKEGGSKELSLRGWVAPTFWAASNELSNPKIVACPADKERLPPALSFASMTDRKVSYFLRLESSFTNSTSIVAGDRSLDMNGAVVRPGLVSIKDPQTVSWNRKLLHEGGGNIALGDGSVHQVTSRQLRTSLETSLTANTIIVP